MDKADVNKSGIRLFAVLFFLVVYPVGVSSAEPVKLYPVTPDDLGSGSSYYTVWYSPGGLGPPTGYFVGHPNTLPRSDRGLVRFNLSSYLLRSAENINLKTARLHFSISGVCGKEKVRVIEISHLNYDAFIFSGNDLVNDDAKVIGTVNIRSDRPCVKEYSINVMPFIKDDIYKGNKYIAFRFRDETAEKKGNPDIAPSGVIFTAPVTQTLQLTIEEK
jgi:hypothetical protein